MRTRPLAAALFLALAPGTFTSSALAQSTADDPTTAMARARFKEGVEFFDKGSFEQARVSFLQAYALKKHPAVLLNLAWSCLKSGHVLDAERYFREFLAEGKDITEKQRADANDGLSQSHGRLGRIEVVAAAGTEITIDGDRVGTTPLPDSPYVEPGAHTIKFKGPDGNTDTTSVTVLAGEKGIARLAKAVSTAPVPPTDQSTEPAPPPPAPPAEEAAPVEHEAAPPVARREAPPPSHGTSAFSAPDNLVPVVFGVVVTLGGAGVAIGMSFSKSAAQTKANNTEANIEANGGRSCVPPTPGSLAGLAAACTALVSDNNDVNSDATVGNIALGVGIAALAGTVLYYFVADKGGDTRSSSSASTVVRRPVLVPVVGRSMGGLSVGMTF